MIKSRWASTVVRRSTLVMAITKETHQLLTDRVGVEEARKIRMTGLLLDFSRSPSPVDLPPEVGSLLERTRSICAIITKVRPEKKLAEFFQPVRRFLESHPDMGFVMGGIGDDAASEELVRSICSSSVSDRCVVLPLLNELEIRAIFGESKFSLWNSVSVGVYHSLVSGGPAGLWNGQVSEHLIRDGVNGLWFGSLSEVEETMKKANSHVWNTEEVRKSVEHADADKLVPALLAAVQGLPAPVAVVRPPEV